MGIVVVVAAIVFGVLSTFYTEILWFREVHYSKIFTTALLTKIGLGAVFGAIFAVLVLINLWIVRKITSPTRLFTVPDPVFERYRATLQPYTKWGVVILSVVFGLFAGSGATVKWREYQLFSHATSFGKTDPIFHRDFGFYVFKLPFHQFVFTWGLSTLVVVTLVSAFAHYFMGGIRPQARSERVAPEVRAHLSVLFGLIVLLKAWGYRLDQFNLLFSPRGTVTGASYTDVHAQLPALKLLVVISVLCAVLFVVNARFKNWLLPLGGIGLLALTSVVAGGVYPAAIQRLRVTPNERIRERPYIERNIEATRASFGLDGVEVRKYSGLAELKRSDITKSQSTVDNIRLWEPSVLVKAYLSLQRIKQYYEFLDVDVDRYTFNDGRRQVMLSAREIDTRALTPDARTWLNTHLVYTHGYGVVASRVDRVTPEGQPDFILSNIPPVATNGGPKITEPRIYFGENRDTPFVIVNSEQRELDYPQGQGETFAETTYKGAGGVRIGDVLRRAAFAWRFRDVNLLISGAIKPESRIMFRRNIFDRVATVAPFLRIDSDPYITIVDGRLKWILDGYTTTANIPYAQRVSFALASGANIGGVGNYIRNSVKFLVDAENGTIDAYRWDEKDPVLAAWMKVFPGIIKDRSLFPADALQHIRYPEGLFNVQATQYANYHITDPDNFYSKEDAWLVANDPTTSLNSAGAITPAVPPYYVLMNLPGEQGVNFVLVRPFTPTQRQNLTSFMVAHSDADKYGKLVAYAFPKSDAIFGPEQVETRINQDTTVSQQVSLWNQQHSQVIYGNLLIIPIANSLLYVQPLYLQGEGSALPELKRVVAVAGGTVKMGETLEEALALIFGKAPSRVTGTPGAVLTGDVRELIQEALSHDAKAVACLRDGDFACFGREQQLERQALERAAEKSGATPSPRPTP